MSEPGNVFTKVMTRKERIRVFILSMEPGNQVACQGSDKKNLKVVPIELEGARMHIAVRYIDNPRLKGSVIVTFNVGRERYFMKTQTIVDELGYYQIRLDRDLFKLQRRDNFRVSLEFHTTGKFIITSWNNQKIQRTIPLVNLSGGGMGFEFKPHEALPLEPRDLIAGKLVLETGFEIKLEAIIKFCKPDGSMGSEIYRGGAEFRNLSLMDKEAIIGEVVGINREIFMLSRMGA